MRFFIDTANVNQIREVQEMGIISGVTTNPSLIAKEGRDYYETLKEISQIVPFGSISGEVKATLTKAEDMIKEGIEISELAENLTVKLPMTAEGLKATKELSAKGIETNVTLVFTVNQALLAANAGATYVSPFIGRIDDVNMDGMRLIEDIANVFYMHAIDTQIIAASVRNTTHVTQCALAGADIATVPYDVLMKMVSHPLTESGIEKFARDYAQAFGN